MTKVLSPVKNYLSWQAEMGGDDFYFTPEMAQLIKKASKPNGNTGVSGAVVNAAPMEMPARPNAKKNLDNKLSLLQQFQALTKSGGAKPTAEKSPANPAARIENPKTLEKKTAVSNFNSLEDIWEEIDKRQLYLLKKLGKETKFPFLKPSGPVSSDLAIISEAPGPEDESEILTGQDGELLDKMLKAIGIERKEIYCTAIVKNHLLSRQLFLTQKKKHLDLLFEELKLVGSKKWIILGEAANQLLLNTGKPLSSLRQQRHLLLKNDILRDVSAFSLEHPTELKNNLAKKKEAWIDLQWIQKQIQ